MKRKVTILTGILVVLQLCCGSLWALPTTAYQAEKVVAGWLKADMQPLGTSLGQQIINIETFSDVDGEPIYYVVYLQPSGFVVVPADDLVEPIIAFADDGTFDPSPDNPLGALVTEDLNGRVTAVRQLEQTKSMTLREAAPSAQAKWERLESLADESGERLLQMGLGSVSDVRVAPLVQSQWSQKTICGSNNCYNYYTPNHYPCGCVATAMAQLMRFHEHPTAGIGRLPFTIKVNGIEETAYTGGGDGLGGPYNWSLMDVTPDCSTTETQREAIGALCYDVGVSINMAYTADGSSAYGDKVPDSLRATFGYDNVIGGYNWGSNIGAGLNGMINPNLDARYPVLLGIKGSGHAVVCDGYGYNSSTLYHHLNMGWSGTDDAWYNLPDINASSYTFDCVDGCAYNIYTSGSGEIISGRVTNMSGNAISGATVTAQRVGGGTYNATTNSKGIYALVKVPSASQYTVSVTKAGYSFTAQIVTTGTSVDGEKTSGNCWGIDFEDTGVNHEPQLSNGLVTPDSGDTNTDFYWYVDYYDTDGDPPAHIRVYIDGNPHDMSLKSGTAASGTYNYITTLPVGLHNYSFSAVDVHSGIATTPTYSGPVVEGASNIISIQKCKVKAGKMAGEDSIRVSGIIDVNAAEIANADEIYVEIWSDADDYLVYNESINRRLLHGKNGKYSYKRKVWKGRPGVISSFNLDLNKNKFSLQAKNIELTGLGCPFSVEIQIGDYFGVGQAGEDIVNGKKPIPIQLMSGYADTLRADKVKFKVGKAGKGDQLQVKGGFALANPSLMELHNQKLILTWGTQTFTTPTGSFPAPDPKKPEQWKCKKTQINEGGIINAKFNMNKCSFKIKLSGADINPKSGTVDFGIAFGSFDETVEADLD